MKFKNKKFIAAGLAKTFWNQASEELRYQMLRTYIIMLNQIDYFDVYLNHSEYAELSKLDWKQLALYNHELVLPSEFRYSVSYHLGIGLYEGYPSADPRLQHEYYRQTNQESKVN